MVLTLYFDLYYAIAADFDMLEVPVFILSRNCLYFQMSRYLNIKIINRIDPLYQINDIYKPLIR